LTVAKWSEYPNFTKAEFDCKETAENNMQHEFMVVLQKIRTDYGKSLTITSGYRSAKHSIERKKGHSDGEHVQGLCADISCRDSQARYELIKLAYKHGITRIGVAKTFIHIGLGTNKLPNNVMWDYS